MVAMTENEAIREFQNIRPHSGMIPVRMAEAVDTAIQALEEVQQYRAIGTVEECREAVEKQTAKKPDGTLYTTKAQRTGCSMCGFGIHMEKRPHRFDLLYESNPKEWDYLMFHMCKDAAGNDYGWAKVLEYIGVGWDPTTIGGNCKGQMSLDDFLKE